MMCYSRNRFIRLLSNIAHAFFHEKAETRVSQQWLEARSEPHSMLLLYVILGITYKYQRMKLTAMSRLFQLHGIHYLP